jgi:hypothetical protein
LVFFLVNLFHLFHFFLDEIGKQEYFYFEWKNNRKNFTLGKMTELFDVILNKYEVYTKLQPKFQQLQLPKLKMLNKK